MTGAKLFIGLALAAALTPAVGKFVEGDGTSPDGRVEVVCDLPVQLRMKNTGGMGPRGPGSGSGLCVFTSIEHSGRYQNVPELFGLQEKMTHEPGGGWPEKVDEMMKKYAPTTEYIQHNGKDVQFLEAALESGRMPGVTYSGRDTRYGGPIAHMVNIVYLDEEQACILDNNYPTKLYWMSRQEFLARWSGWAIVLLAPPPPPVPGKG
jgi:hypothetical protein